MGLISIVREFLKKIPTNCDLIKRSLVNQGSIVQSLLLIRVNQVVLNKLFIRIGRPTVVSSIILIYFWFTGYKGQVRKATVGQAVEKGHLHLV